MTGWSEQTLRSAASWKAFKEGKALFESGAVTESSLTPNGWRGTVRSGSRPLRVGVTVKSATDLETRCPCPENQSSGEFCRHAVASGLAILSGGQSAAPVAVSEVAAPPRDILLPPNWREALTRCKLAATTTVSQRAGADPADHRLAAWFAREAVAASQSLQLHLDGVRVASFLDALAGHPAVFVGKERHRINITSGHRLNLAEADLLGDEVRLMSAEDTGEWHAISGSLWRAGEDFLNRAGDGAMPGSLERAALALVAGKPAVIPVRQLLANLEAWQDWLAFPADCWLETLHFVPAPAKFSLALEGSLQHLETRLAVNYANTPALPPGLGVTPDLPRLSDGRCEIRDLAAEQRAVNRLEAAGFQSLDRAAGTWALSSESAILRFLSRTLPELRQEWIITEGARFSHAHKQLVIVSSNIEILGSGEDWLSFDLNFQTDDGITVPAEEIRRLLRSGKDSGRLSGGRRAVISDELSQVIEPLFSELDLYQKGGHFEARSGSADVVFEIRKKFHKPLENKEQETPKLFPIPANFQAVLRPYQQRGVVWLQDRVLRFGGALLADDMGLGKTVQTIALIENLFTQDAMDSGVVLVVATASLLGNWRAQFGRFAPGRRVRILHGAGRDEERERLQSGEVVLTSYGTLVRDLAWHLRREYRAVVVDEASLMHNPDTDHAKAVCKLRSARRIALTGTPLENSVRDLWSIFRFIQPGWLGGREDFRERYELPLASGEAAVMDRLRLKISPFLLRRTKDEVAPELPSKLLIDEFCELSPDQQAVYRQLLIEGRRQAETLADSGNSGAARMRVLTALLRLRQTCCDLALFEGGRFMALPTARRSAKMERLLELLEEAVNGNHRVLVFSQFQKQLLEIEKCVRERAWGCLRLDGQTRNRQELVDTFQQVDGPPVFLISLKAGGYGLNLTAADTVIHFDPWWNPAAEIQATDRAHRIGQTRPVTVYRLLTRGTVEEKVVRLQTKKRELAATIDESGAGDAPGWSMDDLKTVLGGA